ncbi:MAG: hypothetical protein KJZ93_26885 [Caldilineaceae bacterium]|nr:hypothetical protein [Caldilineaceae bacterium]
MRLLRFLGLLTTLALAFFAAYIFHHRSLGNFFPPWLLDAAPPLRALSRWLPADLLTLALGMSAGAALGFGLLAPAWRAEFGARPRLARPLRPARRRIGQLLIAFTVGAAGAAGLASTVLLDTERWVVQSLWMAAVLLFLVVCGLLAEPLARTTAHGDSSGVGWFQLGGLLALSGLLFGWRSLQPPTLIDEPLAHWGLEALALLRGNQHQLFAGNTAVGPFALAPLALMMGVTGDPFLGLRLTGMLAALLTVLAVWLLASELFRRTPVIGPYDETVEDSGQSIARWATLLTATSTVIVHYSRLPIYLEPVAWGLLGLWALLRAWRTQDGLAAGLSGVLIGLALLLYPSGVVFLLIALGWWIGVWLLQPGWLQRPTGLAGRFYRPWLSVIWVSGIVVITAPQLALWLENPAAFQARFVSAWLPTFQGLLAIFNLDAFNLDAGHGVAGIQARTGVNQLLAPLTILAIGNLLLNLDRFVGWAIFVWVMVGLVVGHALAPEPLFWPALLPLTPALMLALAFVIDRVRTLLVTAVGAWTAQAASYLLVGLLVWVGLLGWLGHAEDMRRISDPAGSTALFIRTMQVGRTPILLVDGQPEDVIWSDPVMQLLVGDQVMSPTAQTLSPPDWPPTLPPRSTLLVQPAARALLAEAQARFPGGVVHIERNQLGSPVLYAYELP